MKYTFSEIIAEQKKPLTEKIKKSIQILKEAQSLSSSKIALAFSGGKDSQVCADLIKRFIPEMHDKMVCIFGNTTCEFPESLRFARKYGREIYGDRFYETEPLRLIDKELRFDFAKKIIAELEEKNMLNLVLKEDGKLSGQKALVGAAELLGYTLDKTNCFFAGHRMDFIYCMEQYGLPLLGKSASKLDAHRINIECFLKYSKTESENDKLKEYYNVLRECKFSQHCCKLLKKEPSERLLAKLGIDVIIKGLMAAESKTRLLSTSVRGHIFASKRPHIKDAPFYHCSPIAFWTDNDVWNYINYYKLEYSKLYDIEYEDKDGHTRHIERNGCMFCGTDLMFSDNHLAVLRQTHPQAYKVAMESFGYREALSKLFKKYNKKSILQAMTPQGHTARLLFTVGELESFSRVRPCAFDEIGDMLNLAGTGVEAEYDPEEADLLEDN
ncbi:MAG: phosphoadenosine phosphosulfate reductase family protein [Ruthenibacterium sp.]